MKLAVMQPYFFPYLGYFQLIHAVDSFVFFDDVNYINRGWVNRNNILLQGQAHLITLELSGASQNKWINQIQVGHNRGKLLKTLQQNYQKAPCFSRVFPLLEEIFNHEAEHLAAFLEYQIRQVCAYLGIHTQWCRSSDFVKPEENKGQDKILDICRQVHASHYINLPGGRDLYDKQVFAAAGMDLSFIQPHAVEYRQLGKPFVPHLSIIDVMMFNSPEQCTTLLEAYHLD